MSNGRRFPRGFSVFDPMGSSSSAGPIRDVVRHDPLESFLAEMMASMAEYEVEAPTDLYAEQQMSAAA